MLIEGHARNMYKVLGVSHRSTVGSPGADDAWCPVDGVRNPSPPGAECMQNGGHISMSAYEATFTLARTHRLNITRKAPRSA
jgi:hypothetical protein